MPLAVSDAVWLGFFGLLAIVVKEYFDRERAKVLADKVEVVHKTTNSLVDKLVSTTKTEAHAAGVKEAEEKAAPARPATAVEVHGDLIPVIDTNVRAIKAEVVDSVEKAVEKAVDQKGQP